MLQHSTWFRLGMLGILLVSLSAQVMADLVFTSPPREQEEKGEDQYGPIATFISKVLGQKVNYVYPENWLRYQKDMREDKYDIVFDGPHFISWRIDHLQHEAVSRLPGPLDFVLLAKASDNEINKIDDMIAKSFCGIAPPNLGTLAILDKFRNPVRQPVVKSIRGGVPQVYGAFKNGQCQAAVVRTVFFNKKIPEDERKGLKVVFKSMAMPNQGFSVGKRVSPADREKLRQAFSSEEGTKAVAGLIKQFGKPDDKFQPTNNKEYEGLNLLLEGVIYGW